MKDVSTATVPEQHDETLIEDLASGRLAMHRLPRHLGCAERVELRRRAVERRAGVALEHIGHHSLDLEHASTRNCENMIGVAQVPIGVIGPLRLRGEHVHDEELLIPLATTEGALIASANRGCNAITAAGGAVVRADNVGISRAPVFRTSGIEETRAFLDWVRAHEGEIRAELEKQSRYLRLLAIKPKALGTTVFLRFVFDSGDAMGMNMATIACDRVIENLIEPATGVECISLSGNYCVDKKPAAVNFQEGRGKSVHAEVVLDKQVLETVLKTNARALVEVQYRKNLLGSVAAGSMGFNAHYANMLAAIFIATGQDPAQVVEGSLGVTCIEPRGPEGVIASVHMPDLPVAAIGGGTALATQKEALALLGVAPDPQRPGYAVMRLAEIVAGTVLAGELSLLAALTSRDLARAHQRLGRSNGDATTRRAG
ncbi:MAG: hydroxymethylglutaryl-CoA reductase (NADPH) [Acidobacteria bacterium]|nr:MAG: hydroxymethylglutaryl-CoA reductase (NADPH) [Acidobacteriota bacterium]